MGLKVIRTFILCLIFLPSLCSAQTIFSGRDEDELVPVESGLLNSLFGKQVENPNAKWGRFKSLQEYGLSGQAEQATIVVPDSSEQEAINAYKKSKDPFSTSERMGRVRDLEPDPEMSQ